MEEFDDEISSSRLFDNFQFANYTALCKRATERGYTDDKWEADFALAALMEIPDQYAAICQLGLLGRRDFTRPLTTVAVMSPSGAMITGSR